jgi:four helix bundle protein
MKDFRKLIAARHARKLVVLTYKVTEAFPREERFGLTAQMRRAAISIGSNIAEGCGRFGDRELVRFLRMSGGSASELEFQTLVATDLGFGQTEGLEELEESVIRERRILARLIVGIQRQNPGRG